MGAEARNVARERGREEAQLLPGQPAPRIAGSADLRAYGGQPRSIVDLVLALVWYITCLRRYVCVSCISLLAAIYRGAHRLKGCDG